MFSKKLHLVTEIKLWRLNGIGTTLVGRLDDPEIAPYYYKQFAFTVFFFPVYFGRFYVVQRSRKIRGWQVAGWLSGAEIDELYGAKANLLFKLRALAIPIALLIPFSILMVQAGISDEQNLHQHNAAINAPPSNSSGVADAGTGPR